jgi:PST family polysaccharide transporter
VSRPFESAATVFHVTVICLGAGAAVFAAVAQFASPLAAFGDSPGAARYVPLLVAAALVERLGFVPDRLLGRDLRFRAAALCVTAGDLAYPVVAVAFALRGWGGWAIVFGNAARMVVKGSLLCLMVSPSSWLHPVPLRWSTFRGIFAFSLPNAVAGATSFASRQWDNLLTAHLFGPQGLAYYQLAYSLSDVPASQVGEKLGDVLLPTFARIEPAKRPESLRRSLRLVALLMFPMAAGLALVSGDLVTLLLRPEWRPVAGRLAVLAALSATFPLAYMTLSYLNACGRPRVVMVLGLLRLAILLGGIVVLGELGGPVLACAAVFLAFGTEAAVGLFLVARLEGLGAGGLARVLIRPALATALLAVAVTVVAAAARPLGIPLALRLALQVAVGAGAYAAAAATLARSSVRDLLDLARRLVRRG